MCIRDRYRRIGKKERGRGEKGESGRTLWRHRLVAVGPAGGRRVYSKKQIAGQDQSVNESDV